MCILSNTPGHIVAHLCSAAHLEQYRNAFPTQMHIWQMEEVASLVNILVVVPESLLDLVDGQLRISHKQALDVIRLREDFRTARVQGSSLATLFAAD